MTCDELLQLLNEYVDGTLDITAAECQPFVQHLAQCNSCQVVVENIRKTIQLYQSGQPFPLPAEFQARLKQALRERWRAKFSAATEHFDEPPRASSG